eukprot:Hpha_TRINITY_DN3170_c0_g1::TRINITY_DN3170_c0_g1_i1::g.96514::m.96514
MVASDVIDETGTVALPTALVISLVAVIAVVVVLWILLVVRVYRRGSAELPLLLLIWVMTSTLGAGLGSWGVSFVTLGDVVLDSQRTLLLQTNDFASLSVFDVLDGAAIIVESLATHLADRHAPLPQYPESHILLKQLLTSTFKSETVVLIYWGAQDGQFMGFGPKPTGYRVTVSKPSNVRERTCEPGKAFCWLLPACNTTDSPSSTTNCSFCETNRGKPPDESACPDWSGARWGTYIVPWNTSAWDAPTENLSHCIADEEGDVRGTRLDGGPGRLWKYDADKCFGHYDARLRPWYNESGSTYWSNVYTYASGGLGITVARAIETKFYDGTPWEGGTPLDWKKTPWFGVAAVDIRIDVLSKFLRDLTPTSGTEMFLVTVGVNEGVIVGSTLETEFKDTKLRRTTDPDLERAPIFAGIESRYGSLTAASHRPPTLYLDSGRWVFMRSMEPRGGRWLLVMIVPWWDVFDVVDEANTLSLLVGVAVCLCAGGAVLIMANVSIRPLDRMLKKMEAVARLDLDSIRKDKPGKVWEFEEMTRYFDLMVDHLRVMRAFMPQSAYMQRLGGDNEEDEGEDTGISRIKSQQSGGIGGFNKIPSLALSPIQETGGIFGAASPFISPGEISTKSSISRNSRGSALPIPSVDLVGSIRTAGSSLLGQCTEKRVSLMVVNIRGWIATIGTTHVAIFSSHHSDYVQGVCEHSKTKRGVVETLRGDRMMVSFNAAVTNARHTVNASLCAALITKNESDSTLSPSAAARMKPVSPSPSAALRPRRSFSRASLARMRTAEEDRINSGDISCGISSSQCIVGPFGSTGIRVFDFLGNCSRIVYGCERAATKWGLSVIADSAVQKDAMHAVSFKFLAVITGRMPKEWRTYLWEMTGEIEAQPVEEWMYQLESQGDPHNAHNRAAESVLLGDSLGALRKLENLGTRDTPNAVAMIRASLTHGLSKEDLDICYFEEGGIPQRPPLESMPKAGTPATGSLRPPGLGSPIEIPDTAMHEEAGPTSATIALTDPTSSVTMPVSSKSKSADSNFDDGPMAADNKADFATTEASPWVDGKECGTVAGAGGAGR